MPVVRLAVYFLTILMGIELPGESLVDRKMYPPQETSSSFDQAISFKQEHIQRAVGDCSQQNCARISISYPRVNAYDAAIKKRISGQIQGILKEQFSFIHQYYGLNTSIDGHLNTIIKDFKDQQLQTPHLPENWKIDISIKAVMAGKDIYTLILDSYIFMGGAHPNTNRKYFSFNLQTGEEVNPGSFISNPQLFKEILKDSLYAHTPNQQKELLAEFLGSQETSSLLIPQEIGILHDGLVCIYNSYELGPHSLDPIEIFLPATALSQVIHSSWN